MELANFVRVLPGGGCIGGTGYLLSRDRVITAVHVVGEAKSVEIQYDAEERPADRPRDADPKPSVITASAEVVWRGDGDCDIGLLELTDPVNRDVVPPRLGFEPLETTTDWESRGWAKASADKERVLDSLVDLLGKASPYGSSQSRAQLKIDVEPEQVDHWKGISGAPVFVQGIHGRLLGIVAEAPKKFKNLLWATPLSFALARGGEEFLAKLGFDAGRERLERLEADLVDLLTAAEPGTVEAMVQGRDSWRNLQQDRKVGELVEAFLATEAEDLFAELVKAKRRLERSGGSPLAVRLIQGVAARVGPLILQRQHAHYLPPDGGGGDPLRLTVATRTVAELVLAGFDGCPARLEAGSGWPDSLARMPLPTAEDGIDPKGRSRVAAYADHLEAAYLTTEEQETVKRMQETPGSEPPVDWVFRQVDGRFRRELRVAEWPRRRFVFYKPEFARDEAEFIAQIGKRLGSILRVESTLHDTEGEAGICDYLQEILEIKEPSDDSEED